MEYTYKLIDGTMILRSDGASIPKDEGNRDYREYQEWVKEGNKADIVTTPEPKQTETLEDRVRQLEEKITLAEVSIEDLKFEKVIIEQEKIIN